jgi:hypothetical protein
MPSYQTIRHELEELITEEDPNVITADMVRFALDNGIYPEFTLSFESEELRAWVIKYLTLMNALTEHKKKLKKL